LPRFAGVHDSADVILIGAASNERLLNFNKGYLLACSTMDAAGTCDVLMNVSTA
jgi:hypothetical protein